MPTPASIFNSTSRTLATVANGLLLLLFLLLVGDWGIDALAIPRRPNRQTVPLVDNQHTVHIYKGNEASSIRGYDTIVNSGKRVSNYMGIPYAKPPIGDLRFKPTVPLDRPLGSFSKPFDASKKPKSCYYWPMTPQDFEKKNLALMMWWNNTEMSEDCLYLNIWTPTKDKASERGGTGKAVMVWIYGGGFFGGSSTLEIYDGAVLAATGDVVVASMQYRTGALGFLFLDDTEAPGNAGLYDQYQAIKWIHENVHVFGGDNTRITLFGESAGAVSVSYHMMSPYTQNYFSRAIMNSGSAIAWWASESRDTAARRALTLAKLVNCQTDDRGGVDSWSAAKIIGCMRHVSPEQLQEKTWNAMDNEFKERHQHYERYHRQKHQQGEGKKIPENLHTVLYFDLPFKPVFRTDFIPTNPMAQLMKDTKNVKQADLLLGVVKDEGIFWVMYALSSIFLHKNGEWNMPFWWGQPLTREQHMEYELLKRSRKDLDLDQDPYQLIVRYFITNHNMDGLISEAVSFEYQVPATIFGQSSWTAKETVDAIDEMTGDKSFKCPTIDFAEMYSKVIGYDGSHSMWMYSFEQRSELLPLPEWTGAMHGYELDYVFGAPFNKRFTGNFYNYTAAEARLSLDVMKFWTNFAKTGDPNRESGPSRGSDRSVAWPAYQIWNRTHIVLKARQSNEPFQIGRDLRHRKCNFWHYQITNIRENIGKKSNCSAEPSYPEAQSLLPTKGSSQSGHSGAALCAVTSILSLAVLSFNSAVPTS